MPRFSIRSRLLRRWMILVAVFVVALAGFAVYRLNGIFGSKDVTSTPSGSVELFWIVLALAVILLLAVGSDYNLLLISRFKEEIGAGLKTGIIRAMAGSDAVVTAAGLVFAATMASFMFSDLRILGQIGTTIALGLLFDTLIVRSFMTPSIAALIGRWFWWPEKVSPPPCAPNASAPRITPSRSSTASVGRRGPSGHLRTTGTLGGGELLGRLWHRQMSVLQTPLQPCDPAQLRNDVHGGQHRDPPDERSKGGVAAIFHGERVLGNTGRSAH